MPQARNQNSRIYGKSVGQDSNRVSSYGDRSMTPEQKAQKQADTQKSYEAWRAAREARLMRPRLLR